MNLVPSAIFDQHAIALGKTGAGKSSAIRLVVEGLLDKEERVIVVTAKSDWWGLKLAQDGKHAGYPVVVFGGDHSDMPLHHLSGKTMAELLGTANRSAVLQMRDFMPGERTQFWIDFASNLFRLLKGKLFLVIDEVHNFAPKGKVLDVKAGQMLHWSNKLASEARGIGITLIGASQRPAKVHNDFLTSCETLIAMRVTTKWDREAIKDWIDGCGDPDRGKEVLNSLAQMKRGDAWVWSPEVEFGPKQVHFPLFKTYDSFRPQTPTDVRRLKGWASVNLDEVKKQLESVVKEAEANDPNKLREQIRTLKSENVHLQTKVASRDAALAVAKGKKKGMIDHGYIKNVTQLLKEEREYSQKLRDYYKGLFDEIQAQFRTMKLAPPKKPTSKKAWEVETSDKAGMPSVASIVQKVYTPELVEQIIGSNHDGKLRSGAERMLAALAMWSPNGMTEGQMRAHAGLKKSGTFSAYMSDLRKGYIEERGGMVFATQQGLDYCKHVAPAPQTTEEVLAIWNPKLREGARRMLAVLVGLSGSSISKEELGNQAGLQKSGTFSAYLSDLKTARLAVVDRDSVSANTETLFL